MKTSSKKRCFIFISLVPLLLAGFLTGCAEMDLDFFSGGSVVDSGVEPVPQNEPYYPSDFKDVLIPGELEWNQENSMSIKTDSFSGGILNFAGRVEVTSLTNFFITSMVNNQWKMTGSVKSNKVLLSFVKPEQTCMIRIVEGEFGLKTEVYVYITKKMGAN